jgi:hypothetical protein
MEPGRAMVEGGVASLPPPPSRHLAAGSCLTPLIRLQSRTVESILMLFKLFVKASPLTAWGAESA